MPVTGTTPRSPRRYVLVCALMATVVVTAFLPALDIFLAGDDFEWLDASYDLVSNPLASFDLINRFFRPLVKWTYLADYLVFGRVGVGYMVTNLIIHFSNALLLGVFLARRLRQPMAGVVAATAFALSPLHSEAVLWAAGRPDTLLLLCWLVSLMLLDRWCERPGMGIAVAFTAVGLLGIGAKESWIVFPFLAGAYLLMVGRRSVGSVFRLTAGLWAAWVVYIVVLLVRPMLSGVPSAVHYADFDLLPALVKTSFTLLAYCGLGWVPLGGWAAVLLAAAIVGGTAAWLLRSSDVFGLWALLWLGATLALVAPFPLAVLRHNYLPLAGFWMVVASIVDRLLRDRPFSSSGRRGVVGATALAALVVVAAEVGFLQLEIADYRLYGDLHRWLCTSYGKIEPELPRDRPLVLVNRGEVHGVEFVAQAVRGRDKTFFVRGGALWQLAFLPPVANFMGRPFDERVRPLEVEIAELPEEITVLLFEDTGFSLQPDLRDTVLEAIAAGGAPSSGISVYQFSVE